MNNPTDNNIQVGSVDDRNRTEQNPNIIERLNLPASPPHDRLRPVKIYKPIPDSQSLVQGNNVLSFNRTVEGIEIYNSTGDSVYREIDAIATQGSIPVPNGSARSESTECRTLNIYVAPGSVAIGKLINGPSAGLCVEGWV